MSGPLLEVERLTVVHKETKKTLVRNISFPLNPGEVLTILGQSGSGKTMTCRAILGIRSGPPAAPRHQPPGLSNPREDLL